jgi:hypothetical protein
VSLFNEKLLSPCQRPAHVGADPGLDERHAIGRNQLPVESSHAIRADLRFEIDGG